MLPVELMKQIRRLEIKTNRIVEEIAGGAYRSVFKGSGMEFDEVREYTPEDDIRHIDWNVSARMGVPYIKKYIEERELNIMLLVDLSASGAFGSGQKSKRQIAAELAALLAFSAGRNGDKVGLMLFTDHTELILPPRAGRKHTLRLIREVLAFEPKSSGTNIEHALKECAQLLHKKCVVFILSDFISGGNYEHTLKILSRKHDIIGVRVRDKVELNWQLPCNINVEDAETGESVSFSGSNANLKRFGTLAQEEMTHSGKIFSRSQIDLIELQSDQDPLQPLIHFFQRRQSRLRRR